MRPTVLLAIDDADLIARLSVEFDQMPEIDYCHYESPNAEHAMMAACWFPHQDLLERYPSIKGLQAVSAGTDHLGSLLDSGLPIARIVDPAQKHGMFEYVLWGVLTYQRDFDRAAAHQHEQAWHLYPQTPASSLTIGVLGLGEMGSYVAEQLAKMDYTVLGWNRSSKSIMGVTTYEGYDQLYTVTSQCDVLVNLLPLTPQTEGILNQALFESLPDGAALINAGRGGHLVEADLIQALQQGTLRGALLDVFDEEPLNENHPFWCTPGIIVTPHMASAASPKAIAQQVRDKLLRLANGEALANPVKPTSRL
jgi:glyoxylate/hydroxypyruvate reductase A